MLVFATFVVSIYGRAVYARACHIATNSTNDSKFAAFKVPLSDFIPYLYMALFNELFFYLTSFMVVIFPIFVIFELTRKDH